VWLMFCLRLISVVEMCCGFLVIVLFSCVFELKFMILC